MGKRERQVPTFMLETLFAQGKSKSDAVKEEFKKSDALRGAIERVLSKPDEWLSIEPDPSGAVERFAKRYCSKDVDSIIDELVELRGFLHHHSKKRQDAWHPDDHRRFACEAILLARVAQDLAVELGKVAMFAPETTSEFERQFALWRGKPAAPR
jgi:hypothetical protein